MSRKLKTSDLKLKKPESLENIFSEEIPYSDPKVRKFWKELEKETALALKSNKKKGKLLCLEF
ncbi:MAG: hypothetical protein PHZ25_00025 [Candidatus Pacebacteria bacterium]|nr:hypothetical protein [Candidatus Paceibacterota bacterium]